MASQAPQPALAAGRPTGVRHWVIVFAIALAVITYIDRVCIGFAMPDISKELGLTPVQISWVFGAFSLAYALFEIPGGFLGDWMGPRRVLMRIVMWWSVFTAATGWAWSLRSLIVTRFCFGMGEAGCFPNLTKAFTTWLPQKERVRAQGYMWLSARWGGAFTPLLVAWVMGLVGWRHSFEVFGCLGIVWAILFFLWYRDDPLKNPKMNAAEREIVRESAKYAAGHVHVPWGRFFASRQVWMLCWQYFAVSYGWYFYITWLPTYLRQARHLELGSTALLSSLPLLCGGLGNPAAVLASAWMVRHACSITLTRRVMACIGCGGAAVFLVLSTHVNDPVLAMVIIGAAGFCNDVVMPGSWASVMDVGGKYAGTLAGAMNMWGNVGGALGPFLIGYILSWTSNNWNITFYLSAAFYLLGVVCWLLLDPVTPLEQES